MTNTLLALASALVLASCAANPVRPECGGWRLAAANAGTFGMFGATHCVGEAAVDRCTAAGGDPAACRGAVYAPRAPVPVYRTQQTLVVTPGSSSMPIQRGAVPGAYYQPGTGWFSVQPLPR